MNAPYLAIEEYLRQKIESGEWKPNTKLPTERKLCEQFGVSRMTVRHALEMLAADDLILKKTGSGTYVKKAKKIRSKVKLSLYEAVDYSDKSIRSIVLLFESILDDYIAKKYLKTEENKELWHIKRLRLVDNTPFSLEEHYMNKDVLPELNKKVMEGSYTNYVINNVGLKDIYNKRIEVSAEGADALTSELLRIPLGHPMLVVKSLGALKDGTIVDLGITKYPHENYKFVTE